MDPVKSHPRRDLIPHVVDYLARAEPSSLYAEYPISPLTYDEGFLKITYTKLANAVNGMAWHLKNAFGQGNGEILAYMGPNDVRYTAAILGALKSGYIIFCTSPRNSVSAQVNLLNRLKCKAILCPTRRPAPVAAILEAHNIMVVEVPDVSALLEVEHAHYPFLKTYSEALSDPIFAVHTSGSTGTPKPIIYSHDTIARNIGLYSLKAPEGFETVHKMYEGKRMFVAFPPFHAAFLVLHFANAIPLGTIMIASTSGTIPTATGMVEALKKTSADVAFLVPSFVSEISQNPELQDFCRKHLELVLYCGGDLPQQVGDKIIDSGIRLINQIGATELGFPTELYSKSNREPEDWKYSQWHQDVGIDMRHVAGDSYELNVVLDARLAPQQPTFATFPNLKEYASRDLYTRHPSKDKSDFWKWTARADDIIVFLNGEKTNPVSMEQYIVARSNEVGAVLVAGAQRFQTALLVEPATGEVVTNKERAQFIERLWPVVEEANQDCPTHAKVSKSHIIFTNPKKPMLRAGKGTIQRAGTMQLYVHELEALYADADKIAEAHDEENATNPYVLNDVPCLTQHVRDIVMTSTNWQELNDRSDFYALGMDSLQTLLIVRKLRQRFKLPELAPSTIYTNPSLQTLAGAIFQLAEHRHAEREMSSQKRLEEMNALLEEFRGEVDALPRHKGTFDQTIAGRRVLVTGSTGALGSHLLHHLLADPNVVHIYCCNRSDGSEALQAKRNQMRGLHFQFDSNRVTFLTTDLSKANLGLPTAEYEKLFHVTSIIHNAWPVNFNLSLSAFRPQLAGLVNLIQLAALANSASLFFVSSIGSVMSYSPASGLVEEEVLVNPVPSLNGYAESKQISESLLDYAAKKLAIDARFARVGQISGAVNYPGVWNPAEWFPSLVISSVQSGALPDSLGVTFNNIDWIPIDVLAEVVIELSFTENSSFSRSAAKVYHPLNIHPVTWDSVRPILSAKLSSILGKQIETLPAEMWLKKIRNNFESIAESQETLDEAKFEVFLRKNPAVKLLGFYEEMFRNRTENRLQTRNTANASAKLRSLGAIKDEWIQKWVNEWVSELDHDVH